MHWIIKVPSICTCTNRWYNVIMMIITRIVRRMALVFFFFLFFWSVHYVIIIMILIIILSTFFPGFHDDCLKSCRTLSQSHDLKILLQNDKIFRCGNSFRVSLSNCCALFIMFQF